METKQFPCRNDTLFTVSLFLFFSFLFLGSILGSEDVQHQESQQSRQSHHIVTKRRLQIRRVAKRKLLLVWRGLRMTVNLLRDDDDTAIEIRRKLIVMWFCLLLLGSCIPPCPDALASSSTKSSETSRPPLFQENYTQRKNVILRVVILLNDHVFPSSIVSATLEWLDWMKMLVEKTHKRSACDRILSTFIHHDLPSS